MNTFQKGDRVRYVPKHAQGDIRHADCRDGCVSSLRDGIVFVKYDNAETMMHTGDEPYTAEGTRWGELHLLGRKI